jgi:hypothetical protein
MKKFTPMPEKVISKLNLQRTKSYRKKLFCLHTGLTMCDCGCGESLVSLYGEDELKNHVDIELLKMVKDEIIRINKHFETLS